MLFCRFFYMTLRVSTFQNAFFIFVELRFVILIAETFERQGILFILLTLYCAQLLHELHFRGTDS